MRRDECSQRHCRPRDPDQGDGPERTIETRTTPGSRCPIIGLPARRLKDACGAAPGWPGSARSLTQPAARHGHLAAIRKRVTPVTLARTRPESGGKPPLTRLRSFRDENRYVSSTVALGPLSRGVAHKPSALLSRVSIFCRVIDRSRCWRGRRRPAVCGCRGWPGRRRGGQVSGRCRDISEPIAADRQVRCYPVLLREPMRRRLTPRFSEPKAGVPTFSTSIRPAWFSRYLD